MWYWGYFFSAFELEKSEHILTLPSQDSTVIDVIFCVCLEGTASVRNQKKRHNVTRWESVGLVLFAHTVRQVFDDGTYHRDGAC